MVNMVAISDYIRSLPDKLFYIATVQARIKINLICFTIKRSKSRIVSSSWEFGTAQSLLVSWFDAFPGLDKSIHNVLLKQVFEKVFINSAGGKHLV